MKNRFGRIAIAVVTLLAVGLAATVWTINSTQEKPQTKVVFHLDSDFGSALIRVAKAEGIFTKHGIDAQLFDFPDGVEAIDALLQSPESEIALASSSGFAFAAHLPLTKSIKIISQLANNDDNYHWVVKNGKGSGIVEGLKGLRLGYPAVSGTKAFADFSLQDHGLTHSDVTLVPMDASDFAEAMAAGTIDAHPSRLLITQKTMEAVENQAHELHDVGAYDWFSVLSATPHTIAKHPAALKAVLAALIETQTFAFANPELARADVAKSFKLKVDQVPSNFSVYLNVRLSNGLLRQMTKNRDLLASQEQLPTSSYFNNARDVIHPDLLSALAPLVVHLG